MATWVISSPPRVWGVARQGTSNSSVLVAPVPPPHVTSCAIFAVFTPAMLFFTLPSPATTAQLAAPAPLQCLARQGSTPLWVLHRASLALRACTDWAPPQLLGALGSVTRVGTAPWVVPRVNALGRAVRGMLCANRLRVSLLLLLLLFLRCAYRLRACSLL
jgi:hypothetical protein